MSENKPDLMAELAEVVRLSERATKGEWTASVGHDVKQQGGVTVVKAWEGRGPQQEHNAAYIVALHNFLRTHHAELEAVVRDAAYGRALREAMEAEYQAAKESRKDGKQEPWITTYTLLRRLKVAADHLSETGIPVTEQHQAVTAMHTTQEP